MSYQTLYTWVKKFKEMGEVGLEDYRGKPIRLQTPRTEEERASGENARLFEEEGSYSRDCPAKKKMEIEERLRSSKDSALLTFSEILKP